MILHPAYVLHCARAVHIPIGSILHYVITLMAGILAAVAS